MSNTTNDKDFANILVNSGNKLHCDTVELLRKNGWRVTVSPYYRDSATGKTREVDLVAVKLFDCCCKDEGYSAVPYGKFQVELFIECKYINRPVVFWFDKKNDFLAKKLIMRGLPNNIGINEVMQNHHYYIIHEVAKLFATSSSAEAALENDQIFKALSQCLSSMLYYTQVSHLFSQSEKIIPVIGAVRYPIIVCNSFDKFAKTNFMNTKPDVIDDNFQLEVNYAYQSLKGFDLTDYFLLDVVALDNLEPFCEHLSNVDVAFIASKLAENNRYMSRREKSKND